MEEKKLIYEIPKTAEFHSVVMTTFSFDFHHFESQVLRPLKQRGITSFNVLVDTTMLDNSIGFSTGHLKSICNHYSVHTIPCIGAFHPKIIFLAGNDEVMFIQGSGNITTGGHGKNHEIFGAYYASKDDKTQLPLIQETWNYLKQLMTAVKGNGTTKFERIEQNCNLLNKVDVTPHNWLSIREDFSIAALYNENTSIWSQLISLLPHDKIQEIKVFSPFYDENGSLIERLSNHFDCSVSAFMQTDKGIHPYKMANNKRVKFYSWDSTERAQLITKKYNRKLHSKIFWFDANQDQYCLFGSPNCTHRAFGTDVRRGTNDEFALLVKLKDKSWIQELGLSGEKIKITPQSNDIIQQNENELEKELGRNTKKIKILGVDQNDELLTVYLSNNTGIANAKLVIYNQWAEALEIQEVEVNKPKLEVKIGIENYKAVTFILLFKNNDEVISNKQIVNTFFDLYNSDPSQENRNLLKLNSRIDLGKNSLFEVIDFFNTLETRKKTNTEIKVGISSTTRPPKPINTLASLTYEEALALNVEDVENQKLLRQHHAVQIFDAIEKYFRNLTKEEDEEDMDDEEDSDSATTGRNRKEKRDKTARVALQSRNVIKDKRKSITRFLTYFDKNLDRALTICGKQTTLMDFAMYLIVLNHLIDFADREVIITKTNEKDVLLPVEGSYLELDSMNSALLNLVGKFISLLYFAPIQETKDQYSQRKMEKYKELCFRTTLFILATMRSKYHESNSLSAWYDVLAYNILLLFGKSDFEFTKQLEEFSKGVSLNHFSIEKTEEVLHLWLSNYDKLLDNINYHVDNKHGICKIIKRIPQSGYAKFIRFARPGYPYSIEFNDFVMPVLYNCMNGELINSKQEFEQKIKII